MVARGKMSLVVLMKKTMKMMVVKSTTLQRRVLQKYRRVLQSFVHHEGSRHFQCHWSKREPVIVNNVLECSYGLSWEPVVMSRACRQKSTKSKQDAILNVKAVNCLDWCEVCLISHSLAWRDFCRNS
jgi:hypothetical protein